MERSWASLKARSYSTPLRAPERERPNEPPGGSGVVSEIPSAWSAAEDTTHWW